MIDPRSGDIVAQLPVGAGRSPWPSATAACGSPTAATRRSRASTLASARSSAPSAQAACRPTSRSAAALCGWPTRRRGPRRGPCRASIRCPRAASAIRVRRQRARRLRPADAERAGGRRGPRLDQPRPQPHRFLRDRRGRNRCTASASGPSTPSTVSCSRPARCGRPAAHPTGCSGSTRCAARSSPRSRSPPRRASGWPARTASPPGSARSGWPTVSPAPCHAWTRASTRSPRRSASVAVPPDWRSVRARSGCSTRPTRAVSRIDPRTNAVSPSDPRRRARHRRRRRRGGGVGHGRRRQPLRRRPRRAPASRPPAAGRLLLTPWSRLRGRHRDT